MFRTVLVAGAGALSAAAWSTRRARTEARRREQEIADAVCGLLARAVVGDRTPITIAGSDATLDRISAAAADTFAVIDAQLADLTQRASRDPLTNLANRTAIMRRIDGIVDLAHSDQVTSALLFIDLDRFKAVNDTYGHQAGDTVLRTIAHRLSRAVRTGDVVARLGGDEFVIVFCDIASGTDLSDRADRLLAAIERSISVDTRDGRHTVTVGVSVGIIMIDATTTLRTAELVDAADHAMYEAKRSGQRIVHVAGTPEPGPVPAVPAEGGHAGTVGRDRRRAMTAHAA